MNIQQPKYRQAKEQIINKIKSGEFPDGSFLPAESILCEMLQIGRNTLRSALRELESEGILDKQQGRQSYIRAERILKAQAAVPAKIAWIDYNFVGGELNLYFEIFKAAAAYTSTLGISLDYVSLNNKANREAFFANSNQYLGAVISSPQKDRLAPETLENLQKIKPLVCIDHLHNSPAEFHVGTDNYLGTKMGIEYLLESGHRNIAFLGVAPSFYSYSPFQDRLKAYKDAIKEHGISLKPEHIIISSNPADFYDIRNLLEKVLHDFPEIDAIFAITDHIAIDMVFALKSLNVNIPFDISLLSFDGFMKGQNISPKLTAIQHPAEKTAQQAVDIIREAHANPSAKPANIYIKPKIIVGETVLKR